MHFCLTIFVKSNSKTLKRILPIIDLKIWRPNTKRVGNLKIYKDAKRKTKLERLKEPKRTEIINYLLSRFDRNTTYLEIGVRNPADNFMHIKADEKYSVDPGLEFESNPADFKVTSDEFFNKLAAGEFLSKDVRFDVIFIDGLHLAEQVDRDIANALKYLKDDGFVVMHDCNPPTEWHAREDYHYVDTGAGSFWNGTTWKAFLKWRSNPNVYSCCIDTDWGVGVITKSYNLGASNDQPNEFYEYATLANDRHKMMNLISFEELKKRLGD